MKRTRNYQNRLKNYKNNKINAVPLCDLYYGLIYIIIYFIDAVL